MIHPQILEKLLPITEEEQAILDGRDSIDRSIYMADGRDVINGTKLLESGKLITVRPHTRFIDFPAHTHDYVEIVYMCSGTTTHWIDGQEILLREGELLLMGQNSRQEIRKAGQQDIAVNFIIRPEFFSETLPFLGNEESPLRTFLVDCLQSGTESQHLHFQVADILPVQNLVENLLWNLISPVPNKRGMNQMTMGLLFLQLTNYTERLRHQTPEQRAVWSVLRYVEEHYADGTLTEAAKLIHYDFAWLSREIKRCTGKTYTELVQERRLTQAAWMLRNTQQRVADIALSVGYENISYFHRLFSARFGRSPKQYRDCK